MKKQQCKEKKIIQKTTRTIYQGMKKLSAGKMYLEENKDRWKNLFKKKNNLNASVGSS